MQKLDLVLFGRHFRFVARIAERRIKQMAGCLANRMQAAPITTDMSHSFTSWVRHRHGTNNLTPEADRIVPLIAAAGASGMNRQQLGHAIDLDRQLLDDLLAGLVRSGLLSVADEAGTVIYRSWHGAT